MKILTGLLVALLLASPAHAELRATYSAAAAAIAPPATPTDICKISGSATKTIYVHRVEISSTQTTAGTNTFFLVKRSTDNAGGTSAAMTAIPFVSVSPAAGATILSYTGNPTLGTTVGNVKALHLFSPAPGSVAVPSIGAWDFNLNPDTQAFVLSGANEVLSVNFAGAALPTGLSVNCSFSWSEK